MRTKYVMASVYSIAHFAVDFGCALLVFGLLTGSPNMVTSLNAANTAVLFLIYNFSAFAMQMPIGLITDHLNRNCLVAACGVLLVALAYASGAED